MHKAGDADPKGAKAGRAFGRNWAEEKATPRQLRFIAGMVNDPVTKDEDAPPGCSGFCCSLAYSVADADEWDAVEAYLKDFGAQGVYLVAHEDFAIGFVKGVNDVWGEVEGNL